MNEEEFDLEKWRLERPMDYIGAIGLINQATNKEEVFWWIYQVTRLHLPDKLYKYCSLGNNVRSNNKKIDSLHKNQIFMSEVKNLNDPFDSKAYFYRPEVLAKYDRLKHCGGRLIDDFTAPIRVASLTSNGVNSMPMWAHYSNNHRGYCIEYNIKDPKNSKLSASTFPVQYTDKRIDITNLMDYQAGKMIRELEIQIAQGKNEILLNDLTMIFVEAFFCNIKHKSWSYEREFRCAVGATIPGMPYLEAYPSAIYIGAKCDETCEKQLIAIAEELNIKSYKMTYNERSINFDLSPQVVREIS